MENKLTTQERVKEFAEVFTPPKLVNKILDHLPKNIWKDPNKKWLDPTCGDGVFLIETKKRLLPYNKLSHILANMLYGVDIQENNVCNCIISLYEIKNEDRLIPIRTKKAITETSKIHDFKGLDGVISLFLLDGKLIRNFICADGLKYQYNFGDNYDADGDQTKLF